MQAGQGLPERSLHSRAACRRTPAGHQREHLGPFNNQPPGQLDGGRVRSVARVHRLSVDQPDPPFTGLRVAVTGSVHHVSRAAGGRRFLHRLGVLIERSERVERGRSREPGRDRIRFDEVNGPAGSKGCSLGRRTLLVIDGQDRNEFRRHRFDGGEDRGLGDLGCLGIHDDCSQRLEGRRQAIATGHGDQAARLAGHSDRASPAAGARGHLLSEVDDRGSSRTPGLATEGEPAIGLIGVDVNVISAAAPDDHQ